MGKIYEKPFSNHQLEILEKKIQDDYLRDEPCRYEVRVDGVAVIEETTDPDRFGNLTDFVQMSSTQEVQVKIWKGKSQYSDIHLLHLERNKPQNGASGSQSLEGLENKMQHDFDRKLRMKEMEWDHRLLKEKYDDLKGDHDELLEYADKIEEELKDLKAKKLHVGDVSLLEVGGIFLEGFVRRNPQMLARLPGGQALAGIIEHDNRQRAMEMQRQMHAPQSPAPEMTFEPADESGPGGDPANADLLFRLRSAFPTETEFNQVMLLLDGLAENPELLPVAIGLIWQGTATATPADQASPIHVVQTEADGPDDENDNDKLTGDEEF
ncbi:MAG: hypothetical protein AAF998_02825 [Bacteroidota bacterium]